LARPPAAWSHGATIDLSRSQVNNALMAVAAATPKRLFNSPGIAGKMIHIPPLIMEV
jgi:hypothetical protein